MINNANSIYLNQGPMGILVLVSYLIFLLLYYTYGFNQYYLTY